MGLGNSTDSLRYRVAAILTWYRDGILAQRIDIKAERQILNDANQSDQAPMCLFISFYPTQAVI